MDDQNPQENPQESKLSAIRAKLLAKFPQLQTLFDKFKPLTAKTDAVKNKLQQISRVKLGIIVGAIILVIILYFIFSNMHQRHQLQQQTVALMVAQASTKSDLKEYIGIPITVGKDVNGQVDSQGGISHLTFTVSGSKGRGTLDATLTNGQLSALSLSLPTGKTYNVLQDEADLQAAAAAKAALEAKQAAMEDNFQQALAAIQAQDYSQAEQRLQQAIQDAYKVPESYRNLGIAYSMHSQYQNCVDAFEHYVALKADDANAYYQLAYCNLQLYQPEVALTNLQKACGLGDQQACTAASQVSAQIASRKTPAPTPSTDTPANTSPGSAEPSSASSTATSQESFQQQMDELSPSMPQ